MSVRVVVADDQTLVRAGFRLLVDSAPDLEVVGEAVDGAEAVELARQQRPEVVLMDIRMPTMDGLEATRQITADPLLAEVRILMLTTFDLDEYVYQALRPGRAGSCSRTPRQAICWPPSGWWRPGMPCWPRASPGG